MSDLLNVFDVAICERLGWTLIHSVWQIAAVTVCYAIGSVWLRSKEPNVRYVLGCIALGSMFIIPSATFFWLGNAQSNSANLPLADYERSSTARSFGPIANSTSNHDELPTSPSVGISPEEPWSFRPALVWLSIFWLAGVVAFSLRPILGIWKVRCLRTSGTSPLSTELVEQANRLATRMGISRPVAFLQSARIEVPTIIGYLRPLVLLPFSALTGLTASQLEQILAHELAHIRRHDYLVNVVQTGIEAMLFYHPGIWWVSAQVRKDREHCCDDMAIRLCGNRASYVRALLTMEEQRSLTSLALTASGGSLLQRTQRLLNHGEPVSQRQRSVTWTSGVLSIGTVALLLVLVAPSVPSRAIVDAAAPNHRNQEQATAELPPELPKTVAEKEPAHAEINPYELTVQITLEEGAKKPLNFTLLDEYYRPGKEWKNIMPGRVRLDLPVREAGNYLLNVSAQGYEQRSVHLTYSDNGVEANTQSIELYRRRYAILRYVVNLQGERDLTGEFVKEGRVAISYGSVPDLHGDWLIRQKGPVLSFEINRDSTNNGFATPINESPFEEIIEAPEPDQYRAQSVSATAGTLLLNRIEGNGPDDRCYAKILVEEITESPPKDIQVIDKLLPPSRAKVPRSVKISNANDSQSSGEFIATIHLEDDAQAEVHIELKDSSGRLLKKWESLQPGELRLRLPVLEHDRYQLVARAQGYAPTVIFFDLSADGVHTTESQFDLYRQRYLIVRYAINTKGERELVGKNIKTGRAAILFGNLPELRDWSITQRDGQVQMILHRVYSFAGFAPMADVSFDNITLAPPPKDYLPEELKLEKGLVFCNRNVGHKPENARYAKVLVEDITEVLPAGVGIINVRR